MNVIRIFLKFLKRARPTDSFLGICFRDHTNIFLKESLGDFFEDSLKITQDIGSILHCDVVCPTGSAESGIVRDDLVECTFERKVESIIGSSTQATGSGVQCKGLILSAVSSLRGPRGKSRANALCRGIANLFELSNLHQPITAVYAHVSTRDRFFASVSVLYQR